DSKFVKIIGDPVYINLRTPRAFDSGKLTIKYRYPSNGNIKIIEAGVLVDAKQWHYDLHSIENRTLSELAGRWSLLKEGDLALLQKESKYKSIENFLSNLPDQAKIATYDHELEVEYKDKNLVNQVSANINRPIRGDYEFYTYLSDKNNYLYFNFTLSDIHKNKDIDPVQIFLYYKNQIIESYFLKDDGILGDIDVVGPDRNIIIDLPAMSEGVYKVEVKTNSDIITKSIQTKQSELSFINKIWISDFKDSPTKIFTDSNEIGVETINPGRLQTIKIGNDNLNIKDTYRKYVSHASNKTSEIQLEKNDIILSGNGVFSFNENELINPVLKKVDASYVIKDNENIEYILARASMPKEENGWQVGTADFDLKKAYRENQRYSFMISVPGLMVDDEINDWIEIKEISIDLQGKNIFDYFKLLKLKLMNLLNG
ncbi:MAG: hypothetical protein NT091_03420, partial [Candidatus Falkowbacteria bacterium]|nr:hypothetical protein [Candidatus Falkowbacteria bacterium]